MWQDFGWLIVLILVLFGLKVLAWVVRESLFNPDFPERHKTKTLITRSKE